MSTSHQLSEVPEIPDIVDWLVTVVLATGGAALAAAGAATLVAANDPTVAEELAGDEITVLTTEHTLTDPEATALAADVIGWTGIGLLVTGLGAVAVAGAYGVARYRARGVDAPPTARQRERHAAVCGAVATLALAAVPLSGVLGGAAAAYLDRGEPDRAVRVGALAGALAAVPGVVILGFAGVGVYSGLAVLDEAWLRLATLLMVLAAAAVSVLVSSGLGGLGGYAAERLLDDD